MSRSASLRLFAFAGIPVSAHWTALIGAAIFSRFQFDPAALLGFFIVVLAHEFGHAAVVRWCRLQVLEIWLTGLGGTCSWRGHATPFQRAVIAWGGVLGQAILFAAVVGGAKLFGQPDTRFSEDLFTTLTASNFLMAMFNLLPVPPLDGAEAWRLPLLAYKEFKWWRKTTFRTKVVRRPKRRASTNLRVVKEDEEEVSQPHYLN